MPYHDQSQPRDPLDTTHHAMYPYAAAFAVGAALLVVGYLWASTSQVHDALRVLLACTFVLVGVVTAGSFVASRLAKVNAEQARIVRQDMYQHINRTAAELAQQLRTYPEQLNEQCQEMGRLMQRLIAGEVGQLRGELATQIAEVRRQLEERDEEYERGYVVGSAKTAEALGASSNGNGRVRQLPTRPS